MYLKEAKCLIMECLVMINFDFFMRKNFFRKVVSVKYRDVKVFHTYELLAKFLTPEMTC